MPTRYLKPGIRDSEALDRVSALAETLFYRLIVTVDDFGRADARPLMVKAACFPIKDSVTAATCEKLMSELMSARLIDLYVVDGKPCLQMCKWDNQPRAKESKFPAPADVCAQVHADARIPRTVLPGTETETETGTDSRARKRTRRHPPDRPEDISAQVWEDWMDLRKAKKAPVTATVLDSARDEAGKAGMTLEAFLHIWCARGSLGLQADWLKPHERGSVTVPGPSGPDPALEKIKRDLAEAAPMPEAVREKLAEFTRRATA